MPNTIWRRWRGAEQLAARYLMEANRHLARSLRARWYALGGRSGSEADGLITHDRGGAGGAGGAAAGGAGVVAFGAATVRGVPVQFALHGIYGLRPREEAAPIEQMDPLTRGALFHEVQFALLNELKARGPAAGERANRLTAALEAADRDAGQDRRAI